MSKISRLSALLLTLVFGAAQAQTPEFANNTTFSNNANCLDCTVSDPFNAVDADLQSFSELDITLGLPGGEVEQKMIWPTNGAIGDSVILSVQIPDAQLSISGAQNVYIETFLGAQSNNDRVRVVEQNINVIQNVDNNFLLIFRPVNVYDRVSVILTSEVAGVTQQFRIRYAVRFSNLGTPGAGACEKAVTQSVNAAPGCIGCEVINPTLAVDADELTFSEFSLPLGLNNAFLEQNLQFASTGLPGDTVELVMEIPNRTLDVNTLGDISVATFFDGTDNGDRQSVANAGVNVIALTGNKFAVRIYPQDPYNIVQVRVNGGLLGANETLYLYYACKVEGGTSGTSPCNPATLESNETSDLCLLCEVQNSNNAVDGNDTTASRLFMPVSLLEGYVEQTLIFPFISNADDEITLYLGLDTLLDLNLLGSITVSTALATTENNDEAIILGNNVTAAGGGNRFEYRFRPNAPFDRVKVTINSQLLGVTSLYIFEGCVTNLEPVIPAPGTCDNGVTTTTDQTNCLLCDVINPTFVIDEDPDSYSLIQLLLAENGSVHQTVNFGKDACEGDTVNIVIEDDNGLIGASVFGSVDFITLDDGVQTSSNPIQAGSLSAGGGNRYIYSFPVPPGITLDAVRLQLNGGLIGLSRGIRWYSACLKTLPPPKVGAPTVDICYNTSITLTANTPEPADITWYDAPTGGNVVATGPTFTTPVLTDTVTYYLEARRPGTTCSSPLRSSSTVNVKPEVPAAVFTDDLSACFGEQVDIVPEPFGASFNFYGDAAGTDLLFTGSFFRINPLVSDSTIYIQLIVDDCPSEVLVPAVVDMKTITPTPVLADSIVICIGADVSIPVQNVSPSATYNWYDAEFGGNRLFTGDTLMLSGVTADTSFYVEAVDTPCGVALSRKFVEIQVVPEPTTSVGATAVFVCPGEDATLVATSDVAQGVVHWYDAATGGTLLATGNTYTFTPQDTLTEVYVGSVYDECEQSVRDLVNVYDQGLIIAGAAYDTTICSGSNIVLEVNPLNPNTTVTWWNAASGGTQLGSGNVYQAMNVTTSATYYAQVDVQGCPSFDRVPVGVNVVNALDLSLAEDTIYFCSSDFNAGEVTFNVNGVVAGTNVSWYNAEIGGLQLANNTASYTLSGTIRDTIEVWFQGDLGGCNSGPRQPAVAIFSEIVGKPIVRDTTICAGQSVTLTAQTLIPGGQIRWWDAASGGNLLAITDTYNTPVLNADRTYYVDVDLGDRCEFLSRTPLVVEVEQLLETPVIFCSTDADELTTSTITFEWNVVPGAVSYQVSVENGPWINANNGNKHEISGLLPGESRSIRVRAVGLVACATSQPSGAVTCRTLECPEITFGVPSLIESCAGDQVVINITGLNNTSYTYGVSFNNQPFTQNTTFTVAPTTTTTYNVVVRNMDEPNCDPEVKTVEVVVFPIPVVDFNFISEVEVTPGALINRFQFFDATTGAASWLWDFGDGSTSTLQNPSHTYAAPADGREEFYTITLTVTSEKGCTETVTVFDAVRVYVVPNIYFPTGFCPDCPDEPDFRPYGEGLYLSSFLIYNQWGNLVYSRLDEADLNDAAWDGTYNGEAQPSGTYVYTAVFRVVSTGETINKQGTVTLIR